MKMRMTDGTIQIIEATGAWGDMIKSWRIMKWKKEDKMWYAPVSLELLDKLADLTQHRLPAPIEAERRRLAAVQEAVDKERVKPDKDVKALYKFPVKPKLYSHQVRAANMALMTFGLITPEGGLNNGNS
jgi:hypothetical protein